MQFSCRLAMWGGLQMRHPLYRNRKFVLKLCTAPNDWWWLWLWCSMMADVYDGYDDWCLMDKPMIAMMSIKTLGLTSSHRGPERWCWQHQPSDPAVESPHGWRSHVGINDDIHRIIGGKMIRDSRRVAHQWMTNNMYVHVYIQWMSFWYTQICRFTSLHTCRHMHKYA